MRWILSIFQSWLMRDYFVFDSISELMEFNIFDVLQSTEVIILFHFQAIPLLTSVSLFKLAPKAFGHEHSELW